MPTAIPAQPVAGAATGISAVTAYDNAILAATNLARTVHGLPRLRWAHRLAASAQAHAVDMAATGVFSHTSADGRTWDARIRATTWRWPGGENIAYGQTSAAEVMAAWLASPPHRANILRAEFRWIGVGYSAAGDYWVQDFGY